ncbi:hypothetical protein [Pseudomonas sp. NPDC087614]|uniref:DUF6414 family protein n=1 Tax=Pseudomonas sp. NPDC087614 TaxID=3364442 RepID=UPI0028EDCCA1|nr:hypothetical protein [uncultured Pseudomonas sp.]
MKSFVYLDEYKMYSLSSQLMQGVTDYILNKNSSSETDSTQQNGQLASGRKMGEIIETASSSYEKKFLHDYAFTLFEDRLLDEQKLVVIGAEDRESSYDDVRKKVSNGKLVQFTSKCVFTDARDVVESLKYMEQNMRSLGVIGTNELRGELASRIDELKASPGGANKAELAKLINSLKDLSDPAKVTEYSAIDKFYHKHLSELLEFNFKNSLNVRMNIGGFIASADLNRSCLKIDEAALIRSYSRVTEIEFVMLGIVTQCGDSGMDANVDPDGDAIPKKESEQLKDALYNCSVALKALEDNFHGRKDNEIVVNPIAIYIQL